MKDQPLFGSEESSDNLGYSARTVLLGKISGPINETVNTHQIPNDSFTTEIDNDTRTATDSIRDSPVVSETSRTPSASSIFEKGETFLGSNLHQLSDSHINKLIRLRFGGNLLQLVKQLLLDLAKKETELIILRRHSFIKEQEFYKLCSEYGNLSSLEVDKILQKSLQKTDNSGVDEVLLELIGGALNEDYLPTKEKQLAMERTKEDKPENIPQRSRKREKRVSSDSKLHHKSNKSTKEGESQQESVGRIRNDSQMSQITAVTAPRATWLKKWLNSTEDLQDVSGHGTPSVLGSFIPNILKPNNETMKPPMELNSIARENSDEEILDSGYSPSDSVIPQANDFSVDKYGFYDSHNIRKVHKNVSENSGDVHTNKANIERGSMTMHNDASKNSSPEAEFGEFNILNKSAAFVGIATTDLTNAKDIKSEKDKSLAKVDINGESLTIHNTSIQKLKQLGELHDLGNMEMEKQWDQYIKSVEGHYKKSNNLFGIRGLNLVDGKDSPLEYYSNNKYYRQLHDLIDKGGIPPKHRGSIWMELTGGDNLRVNGEFERYYQLSIDPNADKLIQSNLNQVDLDLNRTMPSNIFFNNMLQNKPGPLYSKLKRILYAFVLYKPEIGYCQGMNKIVGNLLLGYPNISEEDVFWIFVGLVEEILPRFKTSKLNYFDFQSLQSIKQDQKIICDIYFPKFMPKLHEHLIQNLGVQVEFITINWWLLLFTENFLTLDVWFKIFDNLLLSIVPETKLIALSLAVFKMFESLLFNIDAVDDVYLIMNNLNHNSLSKMNLKYSELIHTSDKFELRIDPKKLNEYRLAYSLEY